MKTLMILLLITVALFGGSYGYLKNLSQKPVNVVYTAKIDAKLNVGKKEEDRALPNFLSVTSEGSILLSSLQASETNGLIQYQKFSAPDVNLADSVQTSFLLKRDVAGNYLYSSARNTVETSYSEWVLQNNTKWLLKNLLAFANPKAKCQLKLSDLLYQCTFEEESEVNNVSQSSQYTVEVYKESLFSNDYHFKVKSTKDAAASTAAFTTESSEAHFIASFTDTLPATSTGEQHWSALSNSKMSLQVQAEVEKNQAKLVDIVELKQILNQQFKEYSNNGSFRKNLSLVLKVRFDEIRPEIDRFLAKADEANLKELNSIILIQASETLDQYILNKYFERFQKNEVLTKHLLTTLALSKNQSTARTDFFAKLQSKHKLNEQAGNLTTVYWLTASNYARQLEDKSAAKKLLEPLTQLLSSEQKLSQPMGLFLLTCAGNAGDVLEFKTVESFANRQELQKSCDYLEAIRYQSDFEVNKNFQMFLSQGNLSKCVKPALDLMTSDSSPLSQDLITVLKSTLANNSAQVQYESELVDYIDNL